MKVSDAPTGALGGAWATPRSSTWWPRRLVLGLLALVATSNLLSPELLVHYLLRGGKAGGHQLIVSVVVIWMTNVAVFALWYWQLDHGGPTAVRAATRIRRTSCSCRWPSRR